MQWGRVLGVTAVFGLIGPLVGGFVALGWTLATLDRHHPAMALAIVVTWTIPLLVGMVIGAPAAVASGLGLGLVSDRIRHGALWVLAATLTTSAVASAFRLAFRHQVDPGATAVAGALAGLICGLICLAFRPTRPDQAGRP